MFEKKKNLDNTRHIHVLINEKRIYTSKIILDMIDYISFQSESITDYIDLNHPSETIGIYHQRFVNSNHEFVKETKDSIILPEYKNLYIEFASDRNNFIVPRKLKKYNNIPIFYDDKKDI